MNLLTQALPHHHASKAGTKVGPLVRVNSDESKILNKVFLKATSPQNSSKVTSNSVIDGQADMLFI